MMVNREIYVELSGLPVRCLYTLFDKMCVWERGTWYCMLVEALLEGQLVYVDKISSITVYAIIGFDISRLHLMTLISHMTPNIYPC